MYLYCSNNYVNACDPAGNDAIWITAKNAAKGAGHASLLIEDGYSGIWYYFYWGPMNENPSIDVLYTKAYTELTKLKNVSFINKKKKTLKLSSFNNSVKSYVKWHKYTSYVYIKGDFRESISYYYYYLHNPSKRPQYSLLKKNCAYMSYELIIHGYVSWYKAAKIRSEQNKGIKIPNLTQLTVAIIFYTHVKY